MENNNTKLKRVLGFAPAYGAAVGLVVSGTAMFSVGSVSGITGNATFISAFIALIPMMMAAFAFGELTAMLPGGGMISDYTLPALGRFWATFALLSGYLVLIATDGGAQLVMGGLAFQRLSGVPQIMVTLLLLLIVVVINVVNVDFYGKIESIVTIAMMVLFVLLAVLGNLHIGEMINVATPVDSTNSFLPEGGWSAVLGATGSAIWFFIGFEFACPMAEENKKPYKYIPYALITGLITIYVVDSLFAIAAVRYTDLEILKSSSTPQIEAASAIMGKWGYIIMVTLTIMASFTTANAYLASLPRMLYGLSRQNLVPKCFSKINKRFRTPIIGIIFTAVIILITIIYITVNGANTDVVQGLINVASITWMVSYAIAMIDVLVLRKKYPDFPRLWKAPYAKITMPLGLLGVAFAIFTLRDYFIYALICMGIVALYCFLWGKYRRIDMKEVPNIEDTVINIKNRSEYLEIWDEAVDEWCKAHASKK